MTSKSKILARGSILQTALFFVNVLVTFLLMPFIIRSLGDRMYGLWIVVGSLIGYYWLIDFGISSAVARYISRGVGRNDDEAINTTINSGLFLYTLGGAAALLLSLVMAFFLPYFLHNISDIIVFRQLLVILGLSFAFNFPMRIFPGILRAHLRYDMITILGFGTLLFRSGLIFYFLRAGYGVIALAVITFVSDIVYRVALFFCAKKVYPRMTFSRHYVKKTAIKEELHFGGFAFISQIAFQMRYNLDNLVIVIFLGLSSVTLYSIASRLITYFRKFIASTLSNMMPLYSQYEGVGDYHSIKEKFVFFSKINGYITMLVGSILVIFGRTFILRWMGESYLYAYAILVVLAVGTIIGLMQRPILDLLRGVSKHRFYALMDITEGVANLVISIILVRVMGVIGVAYGTTIPEFVIQIFVIPRYACRVIGLPQRRYYTECFLGVVLRSLVVIGVPYIFYRDLIQANYWNILLFAGLQTVVFAAGILRFGFTPAEMEMIKNLLKSFSLIRSLRLKFKRA